ncbi:hypothetical protein ma854 [Moumouvirus australiensis]|uniref:Uncharacterized protein n=1 Tax=Moumouvirus australiensis TaxID=2109587 RepID=A0A2P1EMY0_9VIRU|nr:hypothetical protein QKC55_gp050 [Moumouvirus australiensis]AVL95241.1 hypothetical protein ma854 [Moumouvirus australiensis]
MVQTHSQVRRLCLAASPCEKTTQKLDVDTLNVIEDDVYLNDEDEYDLTLSSPKPKQEVNKVQNEHKPCGSGFVCDEWSGGYYWVEFYKTKPDFKPSSTGKLV